MKTRADHKNPITTARELAGLTRTQLQLAAQVSPAQMWNLESGLVSTPTKRLVQTLADLGVDVTQIETRYSEWRRQRGQEIKSRFRPLEAAGGGS